ncbi:MAG: extracellular solute-binding protein [Clostridiaceae bacterium]|nr:extracellular solute-binding protein [Clostridiaceae bacterium]
MNMKKVGVLVLIFALCLSLAACAGSPTTGSTAGSSTAAGTSGTAGTTAAAATNGTITAEPLTLQFLCYNWGDIAYSNDMPVFQELEKRTNIHLEWQLLPAEDNLTKLNLIMSTSDKLPDLISYSGFGDEKKNFDRFASQGLLTPLDDLIEQNAPNIKNFLTNPPYEIPNLKAELTSSDGKLYSLPNVTQVNTGEIFAIRQDWLDKLNLKAPETTDDLYTVLKAFKDQNADGSGDTIPFVPDSGLKDLTILMNAFGSHEDLYVDAKDGTIKYGPLEAAYKEGLAYCNKLYAEGLIDKDYVNANNSEAFRAKIAKNQAGLIYAWPMSGLGYGNTTVANLNPSYKYVSMLPVKGPNGDRYKERPQAMVAPRTVISSTNEHKVETIKYLDYLFSEEGSILMNYGVEDKDYTLDSSGKPQFTDYVLKNSDGKDPATVRGEEGMQIGLPFVATLACESQAATDAAIKNAWTTYVESGVLYPAFPNVPLDEAVLSDISGIITDIQTYVQEQSNDFIMGDRSLDEFDAFVTAVKGMGIDNVLEAYNTAYAKYKAYNN